MCLSIPSEIVEIDSRSSMAVVDIMGVRRQVCLTLLDEPVEVGDFVLVHVGFAMSRIDREDALQSLAFFKEIIDKVAADEAE